MQGDVVQKSWTIGHDVFLEAVVAGQLRHLLKDGHGSTRQLVDALGNVIPNDGTPQVFAYDARRKTLCIPGRRLKEIRAGVQFLY